MPDGRRGNILILDDDSTFRSFVRTLLEGRGFQVIESGSPDEATALFSNKDTVLAIVDYRLPQMDGMSWITRLREAGRNTPIIFCSAIPCDMATFNWLRNVLRVALILRKPLIAESFLEQVESLLPGYEKVYAQEGVSDSVTDYVSTQDNEGMLEDLRKLNRKQQIERAIAQARLEYQDELEASWRTLNELIDIHNNDKSRQDVLIEARSIAHRIRGTAGTVGLEEVGRIAGKLEDFLTSLDGEESFTQEVVWSELIRELAKGHEAVSKARQTSSVGPTAKEKMAVLILSGADDVKTAAEQIETQQLARIELTSNWANLGSSIAKMRYEAVILDASAGNTSTLERAIEIRSLPGYGAIPIGFICDEQNILSDVDDLYAGSSTILHRPVSGPALRGAIEKLFSVALPSKPRVLAIDDDEVLCRFVTGVLASERIDTTYTTNPVEGLDILDELKPDLVLLDVMMPALTGFEVCRRIREDSSCKDVPVVFITSKTSAEARSAAFAVGASDFVTKPVLAAELINRVNTQLNEASRRRLARSRDPETGVMNGDAFMAQCAEMLAAHQGSKKSVAVALLSIDDYDELTIVQGHFAAKQASKCLGELLQVHFRGDDLRARWSDQGFAVAFNNCDRQLAAAALELLQRDFSNTRFSGGSFRFTTTFSAGVADSLEDGVTLEEIIRSANFRMRNARKERTGVVVAAG